MFPIDVEACLGLSDVVLRNIVRRERHRDGYDTAFAAYQPTVIVAKGRSQ